MSLRPDHDAAALRDLMNRFAQVPTAPARQQLTESAQSSMSEAQLDELNPDTLKSYVKKAQDEYGSSPDEPKVKLPKNVHDKIVKHRTGIQTAKKKLAQDVAEAAIAEDSIRPNLAAALKQLGFKGPFKLGQLPKWMAELELGLFGEDTSIMISGDDPEYDAWVAKGYDYGYAYGIETGYQTGLSAQEVLNNAKSDIQNIKGVAESIDPIAQLRADIRRFSL